ncbi:Aste57867_668 [Aphanomyces stellatus]|uniref:Aste57867_668 protein n=1 Tax=Aphanomyces stellatus TaxID=120398 RepID=A0A485K365_9STRA|nr:hypothetical protein As57867_000667 [Aphanomyces stellatus]VFT77893.1 Aste57867_668 [Aphanomyces stellatus]
MNYAGKHECFCRQPKERTCWAEKLYPPDQVKAKFLQIPRQTLIAELQRLVALYAMTQPPSENDQTGHVEVDDDHDLCGFMRLVFGHAWNKPGPKLEDVMLAYETVVSSRYLATRGQVPKRDPPFDFLFSLDDRRFRQEARMDKSSFGLLVSLIKEHEVFSNQAYREQAPVEHQLLVFLAKLGRYGNGGSIEILARYFGISEGSVAQYCKRCIMAIMSLEWDVVYWPDYLERLNIATRIESNNGFEGCVSFVDGTLFPVYARPSEHGEDYYNRKGYYGMAGMIVCDDKKMIRFMDLGWPGAVHDMRVWSNCELALHPEKYFGLLEFLLADSGYTLGEYLLSTNKRIRGMHLSERQQWFNTRVAQ